MTRGDLWKVIAVKHDPELRMKRMTECGQIRLSLNSLQCCGSQIGLCKRSLGEEDKVRRQDVGYTLVIGCMVALTAYTHASQSSQGGLRPTDMPSPTAQPLVIPPTVTSLPTPQAESLQPSSTFRPTLGPSPTTLATPRPPLNTPRSTSRPTPSPIIVSPDTNRVPDGFAHLLLRNPLSIRRPAHPPLRSLHSTLHAPHPPRR